MLKKIKYLTCLITIFISANICGMNDSFEISENLNNKSHQIRANEALYIFYNFIEEVLTRREIVDSALKIPFEQQEDALPIFIEYYRKYYDDLRLPKIDLTRSRESLLEGGLSLEFQAKILDCLTMDTISKLYFEKVDWKEKYNFMISLFDSLKLIQKDLLKKYDKSKKNLRQIAIKNSGNGIDLFAREGNNINTWLNKLIDEAIGKFDSLKSFEEQQLNDELMLNKKKAAKARKKRARRSNILPSADLALDLKLVETKASSHETIEPAAIVETPAPVVSFNVSEDAEHSPQEIIAAAPVEQNENDNDIPLDYIALSLAKKQIGAAKLKQFQSVAKRELSYDEILKLSLLKDNEERNEYIRSLALIAPTTSKTPIKLGGKYLSTLTNLFSPDQEISQTDFEKLIEHGLGGKIVGTRGNKKRITLYQRFQNGVLVEYLKHQDITNFNGIDENNVVKKISFSVEPPHSRGGSKISHMLYPALRDINKKKLECFGIIPAAFTKK